MPAHAVRSTELVDPNSRSGSRSEGDPSVYRPESLIVRELRHQTKNALQRILGIIEDAPELRENARVQSLSQALQRRILLAARVSDALFGLTCHPGSLLSRMRSMSDAVVELLGRRDADVHLAVDIDEEPPEYLHQPLLRIAHEFVGNAVRHGMGDRPSARIAVRLKARSGWIQLTVTDDGPCADPGRHKVGEGLTLAREIAEEHCGSIKLHRLDDRTAAVLMIRPIQKAQHLSLLR